MVPGSLDWLFPLRGHRRDFPGTARSASSIDEEKFLKVVLRCCSTFQGSFGWGLCGNESVKL